MAAGFLDVVLVGILSRFVGGLPFGLLVALAYFAGMWAWRGNDHRGNCAQLESRALRWPAGEFCRGTGPHTCGVVLCGGVVPRFFLDCLDREKQGWHDKIAGTVVVRQPRGTPLICL